MRELTKLERFLIAFRDKAILLGLVLQAVLLGPRPNPDEGDGRLFRFLRSSLNWSSLLLRLCIALAIAPYLYILGWPTLSKLSFVAAEIYASLIVIRFAASIAWRAGSLFVAIRAMWLPILVIAVAGFILFVNDQGREFGVGLMDSDDYHKAPFLAATLIYWALNNWLSARLGLARHFDRPTNDQGYVFWGPRLIGVCAHLFAALSLAFAIYFQPDPKTPGIDWLLVLAAPVTIVLATLFAWFLDWGLVSRRFAGTRKIPRIGIFLTLLVGAELWRRLFLRWSDAVSASSPQAGLIFTAFCISLSALVFLSAISVLRRGKPLGNEATDEELDNDSQAERSLTLFCVLGLGALMIIGTVAIWLWPMPIGQFFGSLTITCFAFGSFLALANLVDLFTSTLAGFGRTAGFDVRPRSILGVLLAIIVLPALVVSYIQPAHKVRLCEGECAGADELKDALVQSPENRPNLEQAALAWYGQAERAYHSVHPKSEAVPMFVVATAGGGIRAAYWTATILQTMDKDLAVPPIANAPDTRPKNLMRNLLFAISSVSGGSVGAAAYAAAVRNHEINQAAVTPTDFLKQDFLAPGVAAMVFIDSLSSFLPDMGEIDRGEALELGFESASQTDGDKKGLLSHKFLNFSPPCKFDGASATTNCNSWRPVLLLNATHQETGRRMITSHVKVERNVFFDSYDALQILNSDVRLSTAAHNSARFSWVSPAGNLISATVPSHNRGYILDGGYFENYGAATALELARNAIEVIDPKHENKVKLVILQISSDPGLQEHRTLVRVKSGPGGCAVTSLQPITAWTSDLANYLELIDATKSAKNEGESWVLPSLNELTAPLAGIMSVREAHGTVAAEELAAAICHGKDEARAPLQDATQWPTVTNAADKGSTQGAKPIDSGRPHFAHLAMCEASGVIPPLGWVLSEHTRLQFPGLLKQCGNADELRDLETALGWPVPTATANAKP